MKFRSLWLAAAFSALAAFNPVMAEEGLVEIGDTELAIDENGLASIAGDILADFSISKVELLVNGEYKADIPLVDGDIAIDNGITDILGPGYTDFSGAAYLGFLQPGSHEVTVRVTDNQGNVREITTTVDIEPFFPEPEEGETDTGGVDFSDVIVSANDDTLQVDNLQVNGEQFDVTLKWNADTGEFEVISALPLNVFLDNPADVGDSDGSGDTFDDDTDLQWDIDSDDFLSDEWLMQQVDPEDRWVFED